jgi:drug/metabolite transporter (DMT)-like permease
VHDLRLGGDTAALWTGGALVFGSAFAYALYLVDAGDVIARMGSLRFIAWAMLVSSAFVLAQFTLTRDLALLRVPASIYGLSLAMAVFSTVLPTWLIAEAIRRLGANTSSLIGSLGPVFTIGLGALILGEAVHGVQLFGAALVLVGVALVTLRPARTATQN